MTKDQLRKVITDLFDVLEKATAGRPLQAMAVALAESLAMSLIDKVLAKTAAG